MPQEYLDALEPAQRLPTWVRSLEDADWSRGGTLVVADGDRLVGFAHVRESRDADVASAQVGEVWAIYLAPDVWGNGYGRRLMAALGQLDEIGYAQVTLWVPDTNSRARRFYEAAGFWPDGAVKHDDSRGFRLRDPTCDTLVTDMKVRGWPWSVPLARLGGRAYGATVRNRGFPGNTYGQAVLAHWAASPR